MILPILTYGHPALRQKGQRIDAVTPEISQFIRDMFDTMYDAAGIGLAAHQVGRPWQITVIDVREVVDRPSTLEWDGQPAVVEDHMPLVLINPQIQPEGESLPGPEGCLSFPEIYGEVPRPQLVSVSALDESGAPIRFKAGGLLGRAVQHEVDHLNGVLFIDRMTPRVKDSLRAELDQLQQATKTSLARG